VRGCPTVQQCVAQQTSAGVAHQRSSKGFLGEGGEEGGVNIGVEEKRRTAVQNKLSSMLFKHKEGLKKDIAKKRAILAKELSLEIAKVVKIT
jgi:hypothetical protein